MTTTQQHETPAAAGRPGPLRDTGPAPAPLHPGLAASLRPLLIDIGVPVGSYYLLRDGFGASLWLSLAVSSIGPAVRAVAGLAAERRANLLALLMLAVNLAGIVVSFLSGDPRAMIAKDSVVSSVIALAILGSVALRRPLMSAGLRPFVTRGQPAREAAWDRLSAGSSRFRRLELLFSTIWGLTLLAECAARLIGAYTLPVTTMVWLGPVFTLGAIGLAMVVGGTAAAPMTNLVDRTTGAADPRQVRLGAATGTLAGSPCTSTRPARASPPPLRLGATAGTLTGSPRTSTRPARASPPPRSRAGAG